MTMNEMLARVEAGVLRQREFVADASHELQSPLTSLRTQLEVSLAHPGEDWSTAAADLLADTLRMERLVRDLLVLARYDAGRRAAPPGPGGPRRPPARGGSSGASHVAGARAGARRWPQHRCAATPTTSRGCCATSWRTRRAHASTLV